MEIPRCAPRGQDGRGLPSIYIGDDMPSRSFHDAHRSPFSSSFSPAIASSIPMSIPNTSEEFRAPPPLPPPRVVPVNGPMSIAAEEYRRRELEPVEELPNYKTRQDRDEGYHSMESRSRDSFTSTKFGLHHDHYQFKHSADAYDNSLLKKLDMRRTLDNRSPPRLGRLSASARDALRPADRFPTLQPLSLPTRMKQPHGQPLLDSPNRYTDTPMHSAVSPRSTPFSHYGSDYRSPRDVTTDYDRSPGARTRRTNSGSATDEASTNDAMDDDTSFTMEETRLRDFHIDTPTSRLSGAGDYHTAGQKRRASSPPGGDEPPLPLYNMTSSEHLRWREGVSRGSPAPRLSANTQDSISSISSSIRTGSYSSNLSPAATSVTSAAVSLVGQGGISPGGGLSPAGGMSPTDTTTTNSTSTCTSPFVASIPLTISPRSTVTRAPQHRPRETAHVISSPTRRVPDVPKSTSLLKRSEFFMCDCCPKKPKKFDSEEQLRYVQRSIENSVTIRMRVSNPVCSAAVPMKWRSNTNAIIAETVSRTRTRPSVTKTRYTSGATAGPARHCPATTELSMRAHSGLAKRIHVATAARSSYEAASFQVGPTRGIRRNRTGTTAYGTCKMCTSSASATPAKSSSAPIISAST